ncbi:MAG: fibronectin type III domain-containing protein [Promethearchaeota archaeon]
MKKIEKLFLLAIISISVVFTPWSFFLIQKEETPVSNSNNDEKADSDNNKEFESEIKINGIRLTFINNFNDSIVISWFTKIKANNPNVKYSVKSSLTVRNSIGTQTPQG